MTGAYWLNLLLIVGKSSLIYVFIIGAIRLFGKKELAQLSIIDLVFILLISNAVQNAMTGTDTSVPGGISAALGLFLTNYIFKLLAYRFKGFSKAVQGEAIMLIYNGKILDDNLKTAKITQEEVEAAVREHGVKECSDVNVAILEVDGNISVVSSNYSQRSIRKHRTHKTLTRLS